MTSFSLQARRQKAWLQAAQRQLHQLSMTSFQCPAVRLPSLLAVQVAVLRAMQCQVCPLRLRLLPGHQLPAQRALPASERARTSGTCCLEPRGRTSGTSAHLSGRAVLNDGSE